MIVELQFDNVASQPQNVPGLHDVCEDVFNSCVKESSCLIHTHNLSMQNT